MALMTQKEARNDGTHAGRAAASWKFDGNTTDATYKAFLKGYEDNDPKVLDAYAPPSWLSGEWAGESLNELLGTCETSRDEDRQDGVAEAYEQAADKAYWAELERVARYHVGWETDCGVWIGDRKKYLRHDKTCHECMRARARRRN